MLESRPAQTAAKKKSGLGNAREPATKISKILKIRQRPQADLAMLNMAQADGLIRLKYLDKSGFCMWSSVSYSYVKTGEQKRLEQTACRGRRLSILAVFSPENSFEYGLVIGSYTSETYIKMLDWYALRAQAHLEKTGEITVIVQDNGSCHTSEQVQVKWSEWQALELYFFFLP